MLLRNLPAILVTIALVLLARGINVWFAPEAPAPRPAAAAVPVSPAIDVPTALGMPRAPAAAASAPRRVVHVAY